MSTFIYITELYWASLIRFYSFNKNWKESLWILIFHFVEFFPWNLSSNFFLRKFLNQFLLSSWLTFNNELHWQEKSLFKKQSNWSKILNFTQSLKWHEKLIRDELHAWPSMTFFSLSLQVFHSIWNFHLLMWLKRNDKKCSRYRENLFSHDEGADERELNSNLRLFTIRGGNCEWILIILSAKVPWETFKWNLKQH